MKYIIRSLHHHDDNEPALFCAWHGFSQFFTRDPARAKSFDTEVDARAYALNELFTAEAGVFEIIPQS